MIAIFYAAGNTTRSPLPVTAPYIIFGVIPIVVGIYVIIKKWKS